MQCVQTMTHQMATLSTAVQATPLTPAAWIPAPADYGSASAPPVPQQEIREPRLPPPERYDGSPGGMQSLPDPMSADLQSPTPDVSHRRSAGSLHHYSANWKS